MKRILTTFILTLLTLSLYAAAFAVTNENDVFIDRQELPDLVIEQMTVAPANLQSGDYVQEVALTIRNRGVASAPAGTVVGVSLMGRFNADDISASYGHLSGSLQPDQREVVIIRATYLMNAGRNILYGKVDVMDSVRELNDDNNYGNTIIEIERPPEGVPDLMVHSVRLLPQGRFTVSCEGGGSCYRAGNDEELSFEVEIINRNSINRSYNNIDVSITDGSGWTATGTANIVYDEREGVISAGGQTATVQLRLNTRSIEAGEHELTVTVDSQRRVGESNEDNNEYISRFRIWKTPEREQAVDRLNRADLVIERVTTDPPRPRSGDMVRMVTVTVANLGIANAPADTSIGVSRSGGFDAEDRSGRYQSLSRELRPGQREDVRIETTYMMEPGRVTLRAKADAFERVQELDENNNYGRVEFEIPRPPQEVPDLIVSSVKLLPAHRHAVRCDDGTSCYRVGRSENLEIEVEIRNRNIINRSYNNIHVTMTDGAGLRVSDTVNIIFEEEDNILGAGGQTGVARLRLNTRNLSTGLHPLSFEVDGNNQVEESNENNNTYPWNVNIFKVFRESNEPLDEAPRILPVTSGSSVVRGSYNRNYRNATADLLLNGEPLISGIAVEGGTIAIPRQGDGYSIGGTFLSGQRLRIRLHATESNGGNAVMRTAESLETVVRYWRPEAPSLREPVQPGQIVVRGLYEGDLVNPRVNLQYSAPGSDTFHHMGTIEARNGVFIFNMDSPLRAGTRLRAEIIAHRSEEDAEWGGGGTPSEHSNVVTVGGTAAEPGLANLRVRTLQFLSDREDTVLREVRAGQAYRLRFTVMNSGEAYVRNAAVMMTGSGTNRLAVLNHEIAPGDDYTYTSPVYFTGVDSGNNTARVVVDPGGAVTETNENDNTAQISARAVSAPRHAIDNNAAYSDLLQYPDLFIEDMRTVPARPRMGDHVTAVLLTISNRGTTPAPEGISNGVSLTGGFDMQDMTAYYMATSRELAPGQSEVVRIDTHYLIASERTQLHAKTDALNRILEIDDDRNFRSVTVQASRPENNTPDLIVRSVRLLPEERTLIAGRGVSYYRVGRAENLEFEAVIGNLNIINQSYRDIGVSISDESGVRASDTVNIDFEEERNVQGRGGQSATATLRFNTRNLSTGLHTLQVKVDTNRRVSESNENNNTYYWDINIFKVFRESDEPLVEAPVILPVQSGSTVVRGSYNRNYGNAFVDLLLNDTPFISNIPVSDGVIEVPMRGEFYSIDGYFYGGQRLRFRLHATQGHNPDAVMQTAESLETTVTYWSPERPVISEPLAAGQNLVLGTYDAELIEPHILIQSAGPNNDSDFRYEGTAELRNGEFMLRLDNPLRPGTKVRARIAGHRNRESLQRGGGGSWSNYSYVVTAGGAEAEGGLPNLYATHLKVISDRDNRLLSELNQGERYRLRFTVHNSGQSYVRRFAVQMTASGISRLVVIEHELEPGGSYIYTSPVLFTARNQGQNSARIVLDPAGAITEADENDNTLAIESPSMGNLPDLTVSEFRISGGNRHATRDGVYEAERDETVNLYVEVTDLSASDRAGGNESRWTRVRVYNNAGWAAAGNVRLERSEGRMWGFVVLELDMQDAAAGVNELIAEVDYREEIQESDETNNESAPLSVSKDYAVSDEPLPDAPVLSKIIAKRGVVRGTYNRDYRNATIDLIKDGHILRRGVEVNQGTFRIEGLSSVETRFGVQMRVELHATVDDGNDPPIRSAMSIEQTIVRNSPTPPVITEPVEEGAREVHISLADCTVSQVVLKAIMPGEDEFRTIDDTLQAEGEFTARFAAPLPSGTKLRADLYCRNFDDPGRSYTVTVGGEQGSPNLTASGIQIFSDREDSEVEQLSSGKRYRLRFTVHNTGEAYIRRFAVNMTASGIRRLVVIQNEIEPGGNYTYTSEAMFRGRAEGTNRVEIVLDPTDTVTETNEDDNTLSWSDRDLSGVAIEGQVPPAMQMRMPAQGNDADDDAGNDAEEQHYKRAPSAPNYMRTATKTSLMQIRFIGNGSSGTNPFDFTDVQQDVADAQTPEEVVVADAVEEAQPTGEENTPDPIPSPTALNVTNSGLFFGIFSGDSIYLPITDTGAGDFSTGPGAETALRMRSDFDDNTLAGAFSLFAHTGWTIVSQTVANSVPDASQVTVVLSRDSDSNFFQITMDATLGTSSITFGSISGFNCFSSAANCP